MGVRMCVRMCAVASSLHREVGARFDARAVRERHRSRGSRRASRNRAERGRDRVGMTAPCRSRSGSNDRAGTHRRLLRLQELGQNLAHAPVRQLIARRQGFLERVADDLRAFARGWVSARDGRGRESARVRPSGMIL